jgi:ankyrin repeat protein
MNYDSGRKIATSINNSNLTHLSKLLENFFPNSELSFIHSKIQQQMTILDYACLVGKEDAVKMIISEWNIKDLNTKNSQGFSPIHYATQSGNIELLNLLVKEYGSKIDIKDLEGNAPIHYAIIHNHKSLIEPLLKLRSDLNEKNNKGQTPLHLAALNGFTGVLEKLLKFNADVKIKDNEGSLPIYSAGKAAVLSISNKKKNEKAKIESKFLNILKILLPLSDIDKEEINQNLIESLNEVQAMKLRKILQEASLGEDFIETDHYISDQDEDYTSDSEDVDLSPKDKRISKVKTHKTISKFEIRKETTGNITSETISHSSETIEEEKKKKRTISTKAKYPDKKSKSHSSNVGDDSNEANMTPNNNNKQNKVPSSKNTSTQDLEGLKAISKPLKKDAQLAPKDIEPDDAGLEEFTASLIQGLENDKKTDVIDLTEDNIVPENIIAPSAPQHLAPLNSPAPSEAALLAASIPINSILAEISQPPVKGINNGISSNSKLTHYITNLSLENITCYVKVMNATGISIQQNIELTKGEFLHNIRQGVVFSFNGTSLFKFACSRKNETLYKDIISAYLEYFNSLPTNDPIKLYNIRLYNKSLSETNESDASKEGYNSSEDKSPEALKNSVTSVPNKTIQQSPLLPIKISSSPNASGPVKKFQGAINMQSSQPELPKISNNNAMPNTNHIGYDIIVLAPDDILGQRIITNSQGVPEEQFIQPTKEGFLNHILIGTQFLFEGKHLLLHIAEQGKKDDPFYKEIISAYINFYKFLPDGHNTKNYTWKILTQHFPELFKSINDANKNAISVEKTYEASQSSAASLPNKPVQQVPVEPKNTSNAINPVPSQIVQVSGILLSNQVYKVGPVGQSKLAILNYPSASHIGCLYLKNLFYYLKQGVKFTDVNGKSLFQAAYEANRKDIVAVYREYFKLLPNGHKSKPSQNFLDNLIKISNDNLTSTMLEGAGPQIIPGGKINPSIPLNFTPIETAQYTPLDVPRATIVAKIDPSTGQLIPVKQAPSAVQPLPVKQAPSVGQPLPAKQAPSAVQPLPVKQVFSTVQPLPVKQVFSTVQPLPVKQVFSTVQPLPVKQVFSTVQPLPIKQAPSAAQPLPVKIATSAGQPLPIKQAPSVAQPLPAKQAPSAVQPLPVKQVFSTVQPLPAKQAPSTGQPLPVKQVFSTVQPLPVKQVFSTVQPLPVKQVLAPFAGQPVTNSNNSSQQSNSIIKVAPHTPGFLKEINDGIISGQFIVYKVSALHIYLGQGKKFVNSQGESLFKSAVRQSNEDIIVNYLMYFATPKGRSEVSISNIRTSKGGIFYTAIHNEWYKVISFLLNNPDSKLDSTNCASLLIEKCINNGVLLNLIKAIEKIEYSKLPLKDILNSNILIDIQNKITGTFAHLALAKNQTVITEKLIEAGINIHATDSQGKSLLHIVAAKGNLHLINLLILEGADISAQDANNDTPLSLACANGNISVVKKLLDAQADINSHNNQGDTPLHIAVKNHNYSVVQELLKRECLIKAKNSEGKTAQDLAHELQDGALMDIFASTGLNKRKFDSNEAELQNKKAKVEEKSKENSEHKFEGENKTEDSSNQKGLYPTDPSKNLLNANNNSISQNSFDFNEVAQKLGSEGNQSNEVKESNATFESNQLSFAAQEPQDQAPQALAQYSSFDEMIDYMDLNEDPYASDPDNELQTMGA